MTARSTSGNPLVRFNRWIEAQVLQKTIRDLINRARFRDGTVPLSDMAIYPDPCAVAYTFAQRKGDPVLRRRQSGLVLGGDWDLHRSPIEENTKLASCRMHWEDGADWEETPTYRKLLAEIAQGKTADGCRSPEELRARYAALDQIFEETRTRGRLLSMEELPEYYRREHGAPLFHVGRDGTLLKSGGGAHRFAIARILRLPEMPGQLGAVHIDAVRADVLRHLSRSRLTGA